MYRKILSIATITFVIFFKSSIADEDVVHVNLGDGYQLTIIFDILYLNDRLDRTVLRIEQVGAQGEDIFICEKPKAILLKVQCDTNNDTLDSSSHKTYSYYYLTKGRVEENSTPLTESAFEEKLRSVSVDKNTLQWVSVLTYMSNQLSNQQRRGFLNYMNPIGGLSALILPIPFLLLLLRYRKLKKQLREQQRNDSDQMKMATDTERKK